MAHQPIVALVQSRYTADDMQIVRETVAKGATDAELYAFLYVAIQHDLDPFLKEIWCYKKPKQGQALSEAPAIIAASVDGVLKHMSRSAGYKGPPLVGVVRKGEEFKFSPTTGEVHHLAGASGEIVGAWGKVERDGLAPLVVFVPYEEMYDSNSPIWKSRPTQMAIKTLQGYTGRKMYPLSGVVSLEEIGLSTSEELLRRPGAAGSDLKTVVFKTALVAGAKALLTAKGYGVTKVNEKAAEFWGDEEAFFWNAWDAPATVIQEKRWADKLAEPVDFNALIGGHGLMIEGEGTERRVTDLPAADPVPEAAPAESETGATETTAEDVGIVGAPEVKDLAPGVVLDTLRLALAEAELPSLHEIATKWTAAERAAAHDWADAFNCHKADSGVFVPQIPDVIWENVRRGLGSVPAAAAEPTTTSEDQSTLGLSE